MKTKVRKANIVLLLLVLTGVVAGITSPGNADLTPGGMGPEMHLPVVLSYMVVYGFLLSAVFVRPHAVMRAILNIKPVWGLVAFCLLSAVWSDDPSLTLRRAMMLALTVLVAAIIGSEFGVATIAQLLGIASLIHIALTFALLPIDPGMLFSWDTPTYIRGLTTHKNFFGLDMGMAVIALALVPIPHVRFLRWPFAGLAFGMLLWSHATGALVATMAAVSVMLMMPIARVKGLKKIPLLALAMSLIAAAAVLLKQSATLLPGLFQKDATLTGRTELWNLLVTAIEHRPLLGYGYDSFWTGLSGESLAVIRSVGWMVPTAHNGYLDLFIGIGAIGALIFFAILILMLRMTWRYASVDRSAASLFPAAFVAFWLVYNLSESELLTRSGTTILLFVVLMASMRRVLAAQRVRMRAAAMETLPNFAVPDFALSDLALDDVLAWEGEEMDWGVGRTG